ncbi:MAG: hypothetical protein NW223_22320 [Hyphomicrobiaceae bacterium]|nr:hypothetical protein [Hyphomicrobiaceae bacterium]
MRKILKLAGMTIGGLVLGLAIILGVSAVFFPEDTSRFPITTFETASRKVVVYAPGGGPRTYVTSSTAAEGQVLVRNRRITMRQDGSVLVDGQKLDLVGFTLLEVYVHPDEKVETRVMRASS